MINFSFWAHKVSLEGIRWMASTEPTVVLPRSQTKGVFGTWVWKFVGLYKARTQISLPCWCESQTCRRRPYWHLASRALASSPEEILTFHNYSSRGNSAGKAGGPKNTLSNIESSANSKVNNSWRVLLNLKEVVLLDPVRDALFLLSRYFRLLSPP